MAQADYIKELEKAVQNVAPKWKSSDPAFVKKYVGTKYNMVGLKIPGLRATAKSNFSFSALPLEEQMEIWEYVWQHSKLHEALSMAIFFWERNIEKVKEETSWKYLKRWTGKIDNWAHSDGISGLYSYLLEQKPGLVFPQLKKWNSSKNPWERRKSILSLVFYNRFREKVLPYNTLIPLVENLLDDENYFVQKGVGWALREIGLRYPKETYSFLKKNHNRITSVAFYAAAEKLNAKQKEELKELRKNARKKK